MGGADDETPHADDGTDRADEPAVDRYLRPFVEDSPLWPVLIVVLAHVVLFFATFLLVAVRDRRIYAIGGLALLVAVSGEWMVRDVRRGRFGLASRALAACWLLAAAAAWAAHVSGIA